MKKLFVELQDGPIEQGSVMTERLKALIIKSLPEFNQAFVQDLSHISQAAGYAGDMTIDKVVHLKDNLYRCDYSYSWQIAWTCSGTQEAGRVTEKVRFTLDDKGEVTFKFLKLDA